MSDMLYVATAYGARFSGIIAKPLLSSQPLKQYLACEVT